MKLQATLIQLIFVIEPIQTDEGTRNDFGSTCSADLPSNSVPSSFTSSEERIEKISNALYLLGYGSILLSAANYLKGDQANNERNGIFVGHWAPTFFILGKVAEDREKHSEGGN